MMRINLPMLQRGVLRLAARRHVSMRDLATRSWTLCPAETAATPPAIALPDALDHVTALSPWRNWETERTLIAGGVGEHAASLAYVVRNVDLVHAHLYAGPAKEQPGFGVERWAYGDLPPRERFGQAALVTNGSGSHFFGNRLLDDFPLALLVDPSLPPLAMLTRPYEHEAGYRDLCGLPRETPVRHARIDELVVYVDFAQNSSKAARYRQLRDRVRTALARDADSRGSDGPVGVFIRRGPSGEPRELANSAAVEAVLEQAGFVIVDTTRCDAAEIARLSMNAGIVAAVEGSHLSHAIYTAADDATFLVFQPPHRFAMAYKEFTDRLDMRFAFLVGRPRPDGFDVDLDELRRMLDILLRSGAAA